MEAHGDPSLRARAHTNHLAFHRLCAERSGGAWERLEGGSASAPTHPFPFLNAASPDGPAADPARLLDQAAVFFAGRDRGEWTLFTRGTGEDADLEREAESRGLALVNPHYPEMVRAEPFGDAGRERAGVEVREIGDAGEAAAYWRLCAEAYATLGFPADLFEMFAARLLDPPSAACLAWADGAAVGGAMTVMLEGVGIVCWVATVPAARGKGVGAAVTRWATDRALADGAEFASLQASPLGKPVYERIGYRHLFDYRVWRYASEAGQMSR